MNTHRFFNQRALPNTPHKLFEKVYEAMDNVNVLLWSESRKDLEQKITKSWDKEYFKRWWADTLIERCSNCLWAHYFSTVRQTEHDRVATQKANEMSNNFEQEFK